MRFDLPPLAWLRAFEASARTLSFTHAASELHLTQAAISKHIRSLELHLREPLFIRKPRGLGLTKAGEAYLPKVQDALQRLSAGTQEVFGNRKNQPLTIRVAVSFALAWLAPRIPAFLAANPGINIRIISSVWSDGFDPNAFDLDIQYGTGKWPGTNAFRLTEETLTPLCSPTLLDEGRLATPQDLERETLLHVLGYQEGWGNWLKAAAVAGLDPSRGLQVDTSALMLELAAAGAGIALGRRSLTEQIRFEGRLVAPFDLELPVTEGFHLLEPERGSRHPHAALFSDWLKAEASKEPFC